MAAEFLFAAIWRLERCRREGHIGSRSKTVSAHAELAGKTTDPWPKDQNASLKRFTRFSVGRARDAKLTEVGSAKGHHRRVLDRQLDDPVQASVAGVSVKLPSTVNGTPVKAVLIEGAAVRQASVFRHRGQRPLASQRSAMPDRTRRCRSVPRSSARCRTHRHCGSRRSRYAKGFDRRVESSHRRE